MQSQACPPYRPGEAYQPRSGLQLSVIIALFVPLIVTAEVFIVSIGVSD
jgi:hypothetical protein